MSPHRRHPAAARLVLLALLVAAAALLATAERTRPRLAAAGLELAGFEQYRGDWSMASDTNAEHADFSFTGGVLSRAAVTARGQPSAAVATSASVDKAADTGVPVARVSLPSNVADAKGRELRYRFVSERLLLRVSLSTEEKPFFMAMRQHRLPKRAGVKPFTVVDAVMLAARELLDSVDASRLAFLAGAPQPVGEVFSPRHVDDIRDAFRPAVNSLIKDFALVAGQMPRSEAEEIERMGVATMETFERMTQWAKLADDAARRSLSGRAGRGRGNAAMRRELKRLAAEAAQHSAAPNEVLSDARKAGRVEAARLQRAHTSAEKLRLRKALGKASGSLFDAVYEAVDDERKKEAQSLNRDPDFAWFSTHRQRNIEEFQKMMPHIRDGITETLFTTMIESKYGSAAVNRVNDVVVWGESEASEWSDGVQDWLEDTVHSADRHQAEASKQMSEKKLAVGEVSIARSSHEAARQGTQRKLTDRGERLFSKQPEEQLKAARAKKTKEGPPPGWRKGAFKIKPKLRLSATVLEAITASQQVHFNSESGTYHDLGLEVKVEDPFASDPTASITGKWEAGNGPWKAGGSVRLTAAGFYDSNPGVRQLDLTGFAAYDDGTTHTGVFVSTVQKFERSSTGGGTVATEPVTTVRPFLSHRLSDTTKFSLSASVSSRPSATLDRAFKASFTHSFDDRTHFDASYQRDRLRDHGTGLTTSDESIARLSLVREFGAPSDVFQPEVRLWAGHKTIHHKQGKSGAAVGVNLRLLSW